MNGDIVEEVYVAQSQGYVIAGKEYYIYKLHKALYGLKKAPRAWYGKLDRYLQSQEFLRSDTEHTLYKKVEKNSDILLVCIYVDDVIYMSSSLDLMWDFREKMKKEFEMSDLGSVSYFLGFEIKQCAAGIHLSQTKYVEDLLKGDNMLQCRSVSVLLVPHARHHLFEDAAETNITLYRQMIGKLIYLTHSRPDIAYSVSLLSRFMHKPIRIHQGAMKHLLRYLAGTKDFGILYQRYGDCVLQGFSDSDWGTNPIDRKSTTGTAFHLGSGVVTWLSKKQDIVALSSTEAEYIALCAACCQGIWINRVLGDCGVRIEEPIVIYCDNKSCIAVAKNPVLHRRAKHIDVKYHYIRDLVSSDEVHLQFCSSTDQLADVFTKCLDVQKFVQFREQLGVCSVCNLQSKARMLAID